MSQPIVKNFPAADGIRGLAVLIVLIVHSMVIFFPKTYDGLAGSGKIGVWLFFVLSAFLLTNTFIQKGFGIHNIYSYVLGRVIRIMPLYILTLLVYSAFGYFSLQDAYTIFKLNSPWGHLWTIAVEFKFYFILPIVAFVLIKMNDRFGLVYTLISAAFIMAIQQWYYPYYDVKPSSTDMIGYISAFVPGMCCAVMLSENTFKKDFVSDAVCALILIGVMLSIPEVRSVFLGIPNDDYLLNKHVHFSFAWTILIFFTLSSSGKANKLFSSKALRQLGKWSFSIYLFHWLVYTQISTNHQNSVFASLFALVLSIIVGALVFYFFERPIEKLRHHIMRNFQR
ncbi:MAG: acyltransferase [Pantoea vagans]|nr:acyltransferase [Pantoea vagans]